MVYKVLLTLFDGVVSGTISDAVQLVRAQRTGDAGAKFTTQSDTIWAATLELLVQVLIGRVTHWAIWRSSKGQETGRPQPSQCLIKGFNISR